MEPSTLRTRGSVLECGCPPWLFASEPEESANELWLPSITRPFSKRQRAGALHDLADIPLPHNSGNCKLFGKHDTRWSGATFFQSHHHSQRDGFAEEGKIGVNLVPIADAFGEGFALAVFTMSQDHAGTASG